MQGFTSPAKGISDGEFTTSQVKCVYKTSTRRSRGNSRIVERQYRYKNNARNEYKSFKIGQLIYLIAINYQIHNELFYAIYGWFMCVQVQEKS